MKKRYQLAEEERHLFRESITGTKPLRQDTVKPPKPRLNTNHLPARRLLHEQVDASFYFSDEFQPLLESEGPARYMRPDVSPYEVKKLRRGDYIPELFLDLHGMTQAEAKEELGALLAACRREHVHCACVMHGHGKHILKQQTPMWLAQHPDVLGFHQAPKMFGGDAALLVLIELDE